MNRSFFVCAVTLGAASLLACGSSKSSDSTATGGGSADEVRSGVVTCDPGALASDRLQPDASGGPDAKSNVTCDSGYTLCRVDPNGPDNDVCSDPTDCYACSKSASPAKATCNLPPKYGKLCPPGAGSCVQDPNGAPGDGVCQPDNAQNACEAAGGSCVALTPTSCASPKHVGDANTYSCGGGLGVECCLP